ncbi:MAG: hypothetical protein AAF517_22020, partial [Planctomycetota bacterium]
MHEMRTLSTHSLLWAPIVACALIILIPRPSISADATEIEALLRGLSSPQEEAYERSESELRKLGTPALAPLARLSTSADSPLTRFRADRVFLSLVESFLLDFETAYRSLD